ncbi:MAG: hypothetical protein AMK71_11820 [Nitrospira bacterium SG8_35_4]|nr:MAG: hypothetical protein AMK71_11820 [Nitrospira bacterium SG8_35_4]
MKFLLCFVHGSNNKKDSESPEDQHSNLILLKPEIIFNLLKNLQKAREQTEVKTIDRALT